MIAEDQWADARLELKTTVLPWLEAHGKEVGEAASRGDAKATEVIVRYTMLRRSFDPMTLVLLKEAIESYRCAG